MSKQACYQTNKQERVSQKDKCGFEFGVRSSIILGKGQRASSSKVPKKGH